MNDLEKIIRHSAHLGAGLALLLREGISPNQAERAIMATLPHANDNGGPAMAEFLRKYILPEAVEATANADRMIADAKEGQ